MRLSRRTAAIVGLLAAAALGALALGWFPQGPLRTLLESRLQRSVGPGSRIGRVRVVPGRLSAEVDGLVLDSPTFRLEARHAVAVLSRRTLRGGGLFVERLQADGGLLVLRVPSGATPPARPPESPIVIRDLQITGATVRYEDPAMGGPVVLRGVDVRGGLGEGELRAAATGGTWERQPAVAIGPLSARLRISPRLDIEIASLEAGLERTRLRVEGPLGRVGALRADLAFDVRADLAELQALAPGLAPASGVLEAKGRASGPTDALHVEAAVSGRELRVAGWPVERAAGDLGYTAGTAAALSATADLRLLGGTGRVDARLDGATARGRVALSGIDAARLQRQLGVPVTLSGTGAAVVRFDGDISRRLGIEAELTASGRTAEVSRFTARARARGGVLVREQALDVAWDVSADGTPAQNAAIGPVRVTATGTARGAFPPLVDARVAALGLGGEASGNVTARGTALRRLALRGGSLDLSRLAPGASGTAQVEFQGSGPLSALTGTGRLSVDALGYRGASFGPVQADITAHGGSAAVEASLPLLRATALVRTPEPSRRGGAVTGTVTLTETPLAPFAPLLGPDRALEGVVSATAEFSTPLAAPARSTAHASVRQLEARSGRLRARADGAFTLALEAGRARVAGLRIEGDGFTARVEGSAGLTAGEPLDLRVAAEAHLPAFVPEGWTVEGDARADVAVTGTAAAPRAEGFATLEGGRIEGPALPPVEVREARVSLMGDTLEVQAFRAETAGGSIALTGRVPLAAAYPKARRDPLAPAAAEQADLALEWTGIDAARVLEHVRPGQGAALEATLAGRVELRGGLGSISEPRARLVLPRTTARIDDLEVELAPAEVRLEKGRVRTGRLVLGAGGAALELEGEADLPARTLEARGTGSLELRALSPFLEEAALSGTADLDLRVRGSFDAPRPAGTVRVRDATLRARALPQAITDFGAEVVLDGRTLTLREAKALLGGGTLTASGTARLDGRELADASFTLRGRDVALRYPPEMRTNLDADLAFTGRSGSFRLAGTVRALRGLYDLDLALQESLLGPVPEALVSPLLRSVALDIRVLTENPVLVRGNIARRLQASGRLSVRGDLETPAPVGTLQVEPGGKVLLQGREFVVGSGRLAYTGNWDPELSLDATSRIHDTAKGEDVDVTVSLTGQLLRPQLALRSDRSYSEAEIAKLIATGDSQSAKTGLAVGAPAASLLTGQLARGLSGLGLDEVSIQPELVAREGSVETGARFTFGKRITPRVDLVYSASLQDPENRFTELKSTPVRDVDLRVRRTAEGDFVLGAGQRFRFGATGTAVPRRERRVRLTGVRLLGDVPLEPADLRAALRAKTGDRKSVWDLQDDADRLRKRLVGDGYLEAEVGARFEGQEAVFRIRAGHRYRWTVSGMDRPPDLTEAVRGALFAEEALERGRVRLVAALRERGHPRAVVKASIEPAGGERLLAFTAVPGPAAAVTVEFPGAAALSQGRLLDAAGGAGTLVTEPAAAAAGIEAAYRADQYLTARAGTPRVVEEDGGARLRVVVPVEEGPRALVTAVRFEGASLAADELARIAALEPGSGYDQDAALAAADRLRAHYYGLGHPAVRVTPRVEPQGADIALVFQVVEGERVTVERVVVEGLRHTSEGLVRGAITLEPGDPLDPRRVADLERRLLDLGVFARASATVSEDNPATVTLTLDEGDRARAGYRVTYDDERGTRGELDGELRGLLGAGLTLGGRVSAGPDLRDFRGYLTVPASLPTGRLTLSGFRLSEDLPLVAGEESGETFERLQVSGQLQATRPLARRWDLLYGYRIKKVTIRSPILTTSVWVAGVDLSVVNDTRDNVIDARRGRFLSLSLEVAPKKLGSDFDFVKGFAQAVFSRPLGERWTWAQGYRAGLAHVFGGEPLVPSEGFEAGGANSIRGFAAGSLGPEGYRFGRQVALVVNQELRYHHPSGVGGVVFYDAGNTFATIDEASLKLRHVLGAGLRWSSPIGLLRLDVGFPLDRRPGEPAAKVFFSFGQAF